MRPRLYEDGEARYSSMRPPSGTKGYPRQAQVSLQEYKVSVSKKEPLRMPTSDGSDPPTGQSRSRGTRLNPDRLERKRATDRETQRAIRAKTKSYIEHLEKTVQTYEQSAGDDLTRNLATKVSEQHSEIVRLQNAVKSAQKILEAAVGIITITEESPPTNDSIPPAAPSQAAVTPAVSGNATPPFSQNGTSKLVPEPDSATSQITAFRHPSVQEAIGQPIQVSEYSSDNPLACGNGTENYLSRFSMNLTQVENDCSFCPLTSAEEDEDVAIRAIFEGWQVTEERHRLDPVWKFLQATDKGLFCRSGLVERLAVLRLMRSMLLYKINPFWHPTPEMPSYMIPCDDQLASPHLSLIDFFVWPTLRAHLVANNITYLPDFAAALFATHLKFRWQYEPQDVFLTHRQTGRHILSGAFKKSLEDLSSWSLGEEFFSLGAGLAQLIPVCTHQENGEDLREQSFSGDSGTTNFNAHATFGEQFDDASAANPRDVLLSNIDLDAYEPPPPVP